MNPIPQDQGRKEMLTKKMKSGIFQTMTDPTEESSLIVHPNTIKQYDARSNLD